MSVRRATGRLAALALAVLVAASGARADDPALVIGAINPRTGQFALQGTAVHEGIALAVEDANARGGIRGRQLRLVSRDDEGKAPRAIAAAEELIGRHGAVALVGGYVDSLVGPVAELAAASQVPYVAAASLDERLTARGNRFFFRVSSLGSYVDATTGAVTDVLRPSAVAILYSHTPGAMQLAARQRAVLERAGVKVAVFEAFAPGLSDFTPFLARIRDAGADVLIADTFFADHLSIVRQLAQVQLRLKAFLGTFGMEFPEVVRRLGPASEGLYGTTSWQPDVNWAGREAESREFVHRHRERFDRDPVPLTMHGYAAARAIVAALERTTGRTVTRQALRDALASGEAQTPMGRVAFDAHGDPVAYERVVLQIQDGRHVVVYPPARATARARVPTR
jgi:branched-chain amino acid transport system substrate-binding protein